MDTCQLLLSCSPITGCVSNMPPKKPPPSATSSSTTDEETSQSSFTQQFKELTQQYNDIKLLISSECGSLRSSIDSLRVDVQQIRDDTAQIQLDLENARSEITVINSDILKEKIKTNDLEQRDRARSVRIFGFSLGASPALDSSDTASLVYQQLIKPAMQHAVSEGILESVPALYAVVEFGHPLSAPPPPPPGSPPVHRVIIVKFMSRFLKATFFRFKRRVLSDHNLRHNSKVSVVDDLTKVNMSAIKRLKSLPDVNSVFYSGRLRLTLVADPERTINITNPYGLTVQDATARI